MSQQKVANQFGFRLGFYGTRAFFMVAAALFGALGVKYISAPSLVLSFCCAFVVYGTMVHPPSDL